MQTESSVTPSEAIIPKKRPEKTIKDLAVRPSDDAIEKMNPSQLKMNFQANVIAGLGFTTDTEILTGYMTSTLRTNFNEAYSNLEEQRVRSDWDGAVAEVLHKLRSIQKNGKIESVTDNYIPKNLRQ